MENPPYNMAFAYSVDEQAAGRDAVFRSVSVTKGPSNGIFNYYYDSKGRRRLKVYPLNLLSDEYFYSVSNQLLEDRSMVSAFYLSGYSVDQYIWLGTRPVAMVKSRFDGSWLPSQESLCPRRGENAACGLYFIVTDNLPKPVLMLNKALQVVGTAEYDPFGYPNRQAVNSQALSGKPVASRAESGQRGRFVPGCGRGLRSRQLFRPALQARNRPEFGAGFEFERTKAAPSVLPEAA